MLEYPILYKRGRKKSTDVKEIDEMSNLALSPKPQKQNLILSSTEGASKEDDVSSFGPDIGSTINAHKSNMIVAQSSPLNNSVQQTNEIIIDSIDTKTLYKNEQRRNTYNHYSKSRKNSYDPNVDFNLEELRLRGRMLPKISIRKEMSEKPGEETSSDDGSESTIQKKFGVTRPTFAKS